MSALKDLLGFTGKAADVVLLGGAIGKANRRDKFADMLEQGQYDQAAQFAARQGEGAYAQLAQQRGLEAQKQAKAGQDEENQIFSGLSIALSEISDPKARQMAFEAMKPGLSQRFGFDENDFSQVPIADPNALRLFGQQFITPETQAAQLLTRQDQAEDVRSNQATERLRGGELAVSQSRLGLDRERFGEDRRQFDAAQKAKTQPSAASLPAIESRGSRTALISETIDRAKQQSNAFNTGPIAGRNPFATNLENTLDTIQANIGFEELQRLRENSPTGGALGQVTERELAFLQSVLGSVRRSQSEKQLDANLENARQQIIASWDRVRRAYEQDFGQPYQGPGANLTAGGQSQAQAQPQQQAAEGPIAVNPQTGERVIFRNGQWEPLR